MKNKRQNKILELISRYDIETQEELIEKLRAEGYTVTQATISRDIRELKLSKVTTERGMYKYIQPKSHSGVSIAKFNLALAESITSVDYALNNVVIKTFPSMAPAIASSIDGIASPSILGCVAGDDCIIVVTRTEDDAGDISEKIKGLMKTV